MLKRIIGVVLVCMLISSSFAFGESAVCRIGGGDSHVFYKDESRTLSNVTRRELVTLKQEFRDAADKQDQMVSLISFLGSPLEHGWAFSATSLSDNASRTAFNKIDDALDLYTSESAKFKIYYDVYRSEVPGTAFVKITKITARSR